MNNFQTILTGIFIALFVFAVMIFSGLIKVGDGVNTDTTALSGNLTIWGTLPSSKVNTFLDSIKNTNQNLRISYQEHSIEKYENDLVSAFISGKGPDLFFLPDELILKEKSYISPISYKSYPQSLFSQSFIDGASVYLGKDGVIGLPVVVDPVMLYYNKDILASASIASPIANWNELFKINNKLTIKKDDGTISQSSIAMGTWDNITNNKDILALLAIQGGNPIVASRADFSLYSTLNTKMTPQSLTFSEVVKFLSEFSDPAGTAYAWNRALPQSRDQFTAGKLAFYVGRASDLFKIQSINPNFSFDVTTIPQPEGVAYKRTLGHIYALSISKYSQNAVLAASVAQFLSNAENSKAAAAALSLAPANKATLSDIPESPYLQNFYSSAIISKTWLDPDPSATNKIFRDMIETTLSNKQSIEESVNKAKDQIDILLK